MAITKIKHITGTLDKAIDYICNGEKTDDGCLVDAFFCTPDSAALQFQLTAARGKRSDSGKYIAHHLIQSFKPGEVSVDAAHEIGIEWARRVLKNKHEYVIATHNDRGHIHNHIIFNSTSFVDGLKYKDCKKTLKELRQFSDQLCKENGLSVIEKKSGTRGKEKFEYEEYMRGSSWKESIRNQIDKLIMDERITSFEELINVLELSGIDCVRNPNGTMKYRAIGQQKFCRDARLGDAYMEEVIRDRIKNRAKYVQEDRKYDEQLVDPVDKKVRKKINVSSEKSKSEIKKVINIAGNEKAKNSKYYKRKLEMLNANELAKTMSYLSKNHFSSIEEFEKKCEETQDEYSLIQKKIKKCDNDIESLSEKIKVCQDFFSVAKDARYAIKHPEEIGKYKVQVQIYNNCLAYFKEHDISLKELKVKEMYDEIKTLRAKRQSFVSARNDIRSYLKELNIIRYNIESSIGENVKTSDSEKRKKTKKSREEL